MKLEFRYELPTEEKVGHLMMEALPGRGSICPVSASVFHEGERVIAAYESGKLVGLGCLSASGQEGALQYVLLPEYAGREIEIYMRKLLGGGRRSFRPQAAAVPAALQLQSGAEPTQEQAV